MSRRVTKSKQVISTCCKNIQKHHEHKHLPHKHKQRPKKDQIEKIISKHSKQRENKRSHTHTLQCAPLTDGVAEAGQAAAGARVSVVVVEATLAVGAVRVVGAVPAVAAVTGGPVQLGVEETLGTLPATLAG